MKVWDWAGIKLAPPGSAVRVASVARHVTDCATRPGTADWFDWLLRMYRIAKMTLESKIQAKYTENIRFS